MKILAVETATPVGSIALADGPEPKAQYMLNVAVTHNRRLLPAIDRILADSAWSLDDIEGLAVSLGPGSFTGLRIGLSIMKGLAWATGKPLAGIPTLEALAANVPLVPYLICPVLDARKGEIFTALYRQPDGWELERLTPYMAVKPEKLVDLIWEKTVLVGNGLLRYGAYLAGILGERLVQAPPHLNIVHATAVAWLAEQRLRRGMVEDVSTCTPLYVRPSEAKRHAW
ncbi:MAG: tRNA (adenosine(37)-N6)-threonylcarbamoyltransferase complex dimerization subunit type 1 TsaB [Syntrophobacteria bacterium]